MARPQAKAALLLLLFATLELFLRSPILLGSVALYQRDLFLLYFPLVQSALRALSEGALPLRDPSSAFGQPLLGDPSSQVLYPPVALHLFLPPHLAYAWFVSIHSVFGALGVALLARRLARGSWLAALVSGVFWLACGPLQSLATLWHHMAGASWIPWVLLCANSVTAAKQGRSAIVLGGVFGSQMLAGSADMCAMSGLLCVLFVATSDSRRLWRVWLGSAAIALALSAGVWFPAIELVLNSARAALSEHARTGWSLHPFSVIEFFLPVPFSAFPLLPEWRAAMFEGREPFLGSVFMGSVLLPLCLAALADARIPRSTRLACFLGVAGAFLISLGKHAAAYSIAVALIPPLRLFRFPSKAMVAVAVLLCVLAGAGASAIRESRRARLGALLGIMVVGGGALTLLSPVLQSFVAVLLDQKQTLAMAVVWSNLPPDLAVSLGLLGLLAACLRWPSGRAGGLLAVALVAGHWRQSVHLHADLNVTLPMNVLAYKPPYLELARPPAGSRVYVDDYGLAPGAARRGPHRDVVWDLQAMGLPLDAATVVAGRATLIPLTGAFWGLDYAWDGDLRLLFDRRLALLTTGLTRLEGTAGFLKLLQLSGVKRVVSLHEEGMDGLKVLSRHSVFRFEDLLIFEVPDARPRAYLTTGRQLGTGSDLTDLIDRRFDPETTVLVDDGSARKPLQGSVGFARVLHRKADRLTVETSSNAPAFLTVIEGSMPGWRVWVDGKPGKVERANAIFIGTEVPTGAHQVEFRFLPVSAVVGFSLTGLTVASLLAWSLLTRKADAK